MRVIKRDDLRLSLSIWLRLAPRWARVALASRDLDKSDEAAKTIATFMCDRLERSRWGVHAPDLRDPHRGHVLPDCDQGEGANDAQTSADSLRCYEERGD